MKSEQRTLSKTEHSNYARRQFLRFLLLSPLLGSSAIISLNKVFADEKSIISAPGDGANVFQFEDAARAKLTPDIYHFIADGADDMKTLRANRKAFDLVQIRVRRLVDVSRIDTSVNLFGQSMETPIILAPVGGQAMMHPEGEIASAKAASSKKHTMIVSTVSSYSIGEIAKAGKGPLWFQLYPSADRNITKQLLKKAEDAGASVVALSADSATRGNQERRIDFRKNNPAKGRPSLGNFKGIKGPPQIGDPSLRWDYIDWLKSNTKMKVIIKDIVTGEDAKLCIQNGVDGLIISNHGGRQEESNRGTLECLPEIAEAVNGKIPVLIDGGFRRGTDIFKALASGASAICIGRPYIWGLSSFGEYGVRQVLELLREELVRIMKFAGTTSIKKITPPYVKWKF